MTFPCPCLIIRSKYRHVSRTHQALALSWDHLVLFIPVALHPETLASRKPAFMLLIRNINGKDRFLLHIDTLRLDSIDRRESAAYT